MDSTELPVAAPDERKKLARDIHEQYHDPLDDWGLRRVVRCYATTLMLRHNCRPAQIERWKPRSN
jgi:hypothetical protein